MAERLPPNTSPEIAEWLELGEAELFDSTSVEPIRSLRLRKAVERDASLAPATVSNLLRASFISPVLAAELQTPAAIAERASKLMPKKQWRVQLGDFGEAVALGVLEHLQGLYVPVVKLHGLQISNETQHGIDLVAFRIDDINELTEIWFVECKAGRTSNSRAGVDACAELSRQRQDEEVIWHLLNYYTERLYNSNRHLWRQFFNHLNSSESDSRCSEEHELFFLWESQRWSPKAHQCLQHCKACPERSTGEPKCAASRQVIFLFQNDLVSLVKQAYQAFGIAAPPVRR